MPAPDDDLFDMAVNAGYFPGYAAPQAAPGAEMPMALPSLQGTPDAPPEGGFMSGGLTPPAPPEGFAATPPPEPTSDLSRQSMSVGVSQSARGFSPEKYRQVSGTEKDLQAEYKTIDANAATREQEYTAPMEAAKNSEIDAKQAQIAAAVEKISAEGRAADLHRQLQTEFAAKNLELDAMAMAKSTEAKNNYMTAIADFRATKIDPGQLWGAMTGGERFGTMVSAFVHDFLGAKGIKTSTMDTINGAIRRNIDAQIQNLKTKGEVAEGFKSLYWMQRNEAKSEVEARARIEGFMLEATKQQVISEMAKYESGLATAQGQAAIAEIDKAFAKNLVDIYKHIDNNVLQEKGQAVQAWKAKLDAANAAYANSLRAQELKQRQKEYEDAKNAAAQQSALKDLIPDTSESGGGAMRWQFREGLSPEQKKEVLNKVELTGAMSEDIREYRSMLRQYDAINDITAKSRFADTNAAKMRELQIKIVLDDTLRRTGKAATQQERQAIESRFPLNTWATNANVEQVVSGFEKHAYRDLNKTIQTYAVDLPEGDARRSLRGAQGAFAAPEGIEANAVHSGEAGRLSPEQQKRKEAAGMLIGKAASVAHDGEDVGAAARKSWSNFTKRQPEQASEFVNTEARHIKPGQVPGLAVGVSRLAEMARKGDKEALKQLEQAAQGYMTDGVIGNEKDWLGAYAAFELSGIRGGKEE